MNRSTHGDSSLMFHINSIIEREVLTLSVSIDGDSMLQIL